MKSLLLLVTALGAVSAPAQVPTTSSKSTIITALPYSITAPGTYILQSNLINPVPNIPAIAIATEASGPILGPVVVDLKGHIITGAGLGSVGVMLFTSYNNPYPITIRNGTFSNIQNGVQAVGGEEIGKTGVTISSIVFNLVYLDNPGNPNPSIAIGVEFQSALGCSVTNCIFNAIQDTIGDGTYGIYDIDPMGGNTYNNNAFNFITVPLTVTTFFDEGIQRLGINCQTKPVKNSAILP